MATGDKNIIAIANKDSLKYKSTRDYGAGSIVLKDKLFYEANGDVPSGTAFAEGDTGATWQLVGGTPIEDFDTAADYSTGDQVFHLGSLMQANTDITAGAFDQAQWDIKVNLLNESVFSNTKTLTENGTIELIGDYIEPSNADNLNIGSMAKPLSGVYTQRVRFTNGASDYKGEIDVDSSNFEINSTEQIQFKPSGETTSTLVLDGDAATFQKPLVVDNNQGLRIMDGDSSGRESWLIDIGNSNGVRFSYLDSSSNTTPVATFLRVNSSDFRFCPDQTSSSFNTYLGQNGEDDSNRWTRLYVTSSTSVSSDERLKNSIEKLPTELLDVWFDFVNFKSYKLNRDGFKGVRHVGIIAQEVEAAFSAAGLQIEEWDVIDYSSGEDRMMSVSYDHVFSIEMAAHRRKLEKLEAKLALL